MKYQQNADGTLQWLENRRRPQRERELYTDVFTFHQSRFETHFNVRDSFILKENLRAWPFYF